MKPPPWKYSMLALRRRQRRIVTPGGTTAGLRPTLTRTRLVARQAGQRRRRGVALDAARPTRPGRSGACLLAKRTKADMVRSISWPIVGRQRLARRCRTDGQRAAQPNTVEIIHLAWMFTPLARKPWCKRPAMTNDGSGLMPVKPIRSAEITICRANAARILRSRPRLCLAPTSPGSRPSHRHLAWRRSPEPCRPSGERPVGWRRDARAAPRGRVAV